MTNLAALLTENVNGATFIAIDTETDVKLKGGKKNPHQGRVTKRTVGSNVMVFQNKSINGYEAMVQRRLKKEGKDPASFELSPRKWGTRLQGVPFVEHKGNYYVEVIFLKAGYTVYLLDGHAVDRSAAMPGVSRSGWLEMRIARRDTLFHWAIGWRIRLP